MEKTKAVTWIAIALLAGAWFYFWYIKPSLYAKKELADDKKTVNVDDSLRFNFLNDPLPLADGGAYSQDITTMELWYLYKDKAYKVKKVQGNPPTVKSSALSTKKEKALWVQLQRERQKRKELELMDSPQEEPYEPEMVR